jgi:hypothetical protein
MIIRFKYQDAIQDMAESLLNEEIALSNTLGAGLPRVDHLASQMIGAGITLQSLFSL